MSDSVLGKLMGKADAKRSYDVLVDRMNAQKKRIIHAEGEEHKAKNALDAASDALEQEREALKALKREFYSLAREDGIEPEKPS